MVENLEARVVEGRDDQSLWFVLQNQDLFYQTGYKALQGRSGKGFIPCYKLMYNGKVKLAYDVSGYKTLESALPDLSCEQMASIFLATVETAATVQDNGFIRCDNIATEADKIFLGADNQVGLIYLPIRPNENGSGFSELEERLRRELAAALRRCRAPLDGLLTQACGELEDLAYTIQEVGKTLTKGYANKDLNELEDSLIGGTKAEKEVTLDSKRKGPLGWLKKKSVENKKEQPQPAQQQGFLPELILESVEPAGISLQIDKQQYFIGKNPHTVDGLIESSNAISRTHCKIEWREGGYTLADVGSVNGTFLNGERLTSGTAVGIKIGDIIKVANVTFKVKKK